MDAPVLEVIDREQARRRPDLAALLELVAEADGDQPLSEHKRVELFGAGHHALVGVVAADPDGSLVGYAQLSKGSEGWGLELVTRPDRRGGGEPLLRSLLAAALDQARQAGGGPVRLWQSRPTPERHQVALDAGARVERELLQMRAPLPLDTATRDPASGMQLRSFHPGQDEERWLVVNNRAFADHPEQGGWDLDTVRARETEPWFDPAGFLLLEDRGSLVGFCWTKVHADTDPPMGEIYAIAVDPDHHGRGLGRALTVAGLEWLHDAGLTTGMLYVDGANAAAVGLYRSLGFTVHHTDRSYRFDVG